MAADEKSERPSLKSERPSLSPQPVLPGWFTLDAGQPHLIGSRCESCGTYYFPKVSGFCRNPDCASESFEEVELSRTGTLWSYTDACYAPPAPFVAADPHRPFAIAAVELDKEKMVVLGPVADGVAAADLAVGAKIELVLEPLNDGKLTWKWRPTGALSPNPSPASGRGESSRATNSPLPRAGEGGAKRRERA